MAPPDSDPREPSGEPAAAPAAGAVSRPAGAVHQPVGAVHRTAGGEPTDRLASALLGLALVLAAARFLRLGEWSLWHDEALTLHDLSDLLAGRATPSHPLGVGLVALWTRAVGAAWPSEVDLRLLPALAGALSIPLTAWAFRPFAGRRRAALAALLVAASSWHLYWSQNARFYTFALTLSLLGGGLYLRGLWRGRFGPLAAGLLAWALTPGMHLSGLLVPVGLVAGTAVLPWLRVGLPPEAARVRRRLLAGAALLVLVGAAVAAPRWGEYLGKKGIASLGAGVVHFGLTTGWYVTPLLGTAALAGAWVALRRRDPFDALVLAGVVAALAAAALASTVAVVSAQYVFCLLPWIAVLATAPLGALDRPGEGARAAPAVVYAALLVLPALAGLAMYFGPYAGERPRWRDAYRYVWNERGPDDLVLGANSPVGEYYLNPGHEALRTPRRVVRHDGYTSEIPVEWLRHPRRTWLVVQRERFEAATWWPEDRADTLAMLREQFRMVEAFPLQVGTRDLSVWVYVRD